MKRAADNQDADTNSHNRQQAKSLRAMFTNPGLVSSLNTQQEQEVGSSNTRGLNNKVSRSNHRNDRPKDNYDYEYARLISKDTNFSGNLDYLEDNAEKLGKMAEDKGSSRAGKPTQSFAGRCSYCINNQEAHSDLHVIAFGTKVYLAVPRKAPVIPGYCIIVPMEHHLNCVECDDEEWTETRNFMKCLTKAFHEKEKGVIFVETAMSYRKSFHSIIECFPLPWHNYDNAPAYFKNSILSAAEEWSQNRKLISTAKDFRNALVKNLPYFHVWTRIDEGYGHVIENESRFSRDFGKEIIAGILELPVTAWRNPKRLSRKELDDLVKEFEKSYKPFDWTDLIE